jgi:sterol desaturase/sphingolipid hydroxylase (fatty acid hydroxylase superfamily)
MNFPRIYNKGQARIFSNPILESLSKTRPWIIYCMYIPLSMYMIYYSYSQLNYSGAFIACIFLAGLGCWTFFEYIAHRYLFHFHAEGPVGRRLVYIFHGNHHEYPRDRMRLFMPPVPSLILASVVFALIWGMFKLLASTGDYALIFFPGFLVGYLIYVSMHYAIHSYAPPKPLKTLWRNHHLHHYKNPDKGFGVSSSFWDFVFSTLPVADDQAHDGPVQEGNHDSSREYPVNS